MPGRPKEGGRGHHSEGTPLSIRVGSQLRADGSTRRHWKFGNDDLEENIRPLILPPREGRITSQEQREQARGGWCGEGHAALPRH